MINKEVLKLNSLVKAISLLTSEHVLTLNITQLLC